MEQAKSQEQLRLVSEDHPLLNQPLQNFEFNDPLADPVKIANTLAELMFNNGGVGLSANQLGLPHRIFVMRTAPTITVCINPRLVDISEEQVLMEEGCLSYPGLHVKIKRPAHVKVRFQTVTGDTVTERYTGLTARVFQHELDHMNGENFLDRAGSMAKQVAMKKWAKLKKMQNLKRKIWNGR